MAKVRMPILCACLVLFFGAAAPPVVGQPIDVKVSATSPVWWTLTDEVTPAMLREAFVSKPAQEKRLATAISEGRVPALPASRTVRFYLSARRNPELIPMWLAFSTFVSAHLLIDGETRISDAMYSFGLSPADASRIIGLSRDFNREGAELLDSNGTKQLRYLELEAQALKTKRAAKSTLRLAIATSTHEELARSLGISRAEAQELAEAMSTDPWAATAEKYLPLLLRELSPQSWDSFRRYLLGTIVPQMGDMIDVEDEGAN